MGNDFNRDLNFLFTIFYNLYIWFQSFSTECKLRLQWSVICVQVKSCTLLHKFFFYIKDLHSNIKPTVCTNSLHSIFSQNNVRVLFLKQPIRIRAPLRLKKLYISVAINSFIKFYSPFIVYHYKTLLSEKI